MGVLRMGGIGFILIAIAAGSVNTLQLALLTGIKAERGTLAATWVSMLASLAGMAILLGAVLATTGSLELPAPFTRWWLFAGFALACLALLFLAGKGLPWYLLATGALSIPYLLAAAWAGPKVGLGVYLAAVVTGQLTTSVILDHIGAFGLTTRAIDPIRAGGILVLLVGVVMIRGRN